MIDSYIAQFKFREGVHHNGVGFDPFPWSTERKRVGTLSKAHLVAISFTYLHYSLRLGSKIKYVVLLTPSP